MPVSDYTIDNLLLHLKALDALGLWKSPTWDEVAKTLGCSEASATMIGDIDHLLIGKICEELHIDPDDEEWFGKAVSVLRIKKRNPSFDDLVNAFYERQHSRRLTTVFELEGEEIEIPQDIWYKLHGVHPYPHEGVELWLSKKNEALSGERPFDLLRSGEFEQVRTELDRLLDEKEAREREKFEREQAERDRIAARRRWNPFWRILDAYETRRLRKMVKAIDQVAPKEIEIFRR